jgi:hypothetical protein
MMQRISDTEVIFGSYPQKEIPGPLSAGNPARMLKTPSQEYEAMLQKEFLQGKGPLWMDMMHKDGTMIRQRVVSLIPKYYKYEPIVWQILSETETEMELVSASVLDGQVFHPQYHTVHIPFTGTWHYILNTAIPASVYDHSFLCLWLNTVFMTTAFSTEQQGRLLETMPANEVLSTYKSDALPAVRPCITLISKKEYETLGCPAKPMSDYAQCSSINDWWLKDPWYDSFSDTKEEGALVTTARKGFGDVDHLCGIVPKMRIRK